MLINASKLVNCPVLSLHVGNRIASVSEAIVDPNDLKIIAFRVEGPLVGKDTGEILPIDSIREFSRLGIIIDSIDELVDADDIIRIRDILKLNFNLKGLKVETKKKSKLGKVGDFTVNSSDWHVQQLIVQRPLVKSFLDPELVIDRNRIIEVDDYKVIVKEEVETPKVKATKTEFSPNFINPFREPDFASESKTEE